MLILGLSLLATNHEWAERLMDRVKQEVNKANARVAEPDPITKWGIDIFSVVFIAVAVLLFTRFTGSLAISSAVSFVIVGVLMIATNQNRYKKITDKFKRKH